MPEPPLSLASMRFPTPYMNPGRPPKLAARHDVEQGECEQAFFVEPFVVVADEKHSASDHRWRAFGRTTNNRHLHMVFTVRADRIRVIHARDMNRKERSAYAAAQARLEANPDI
jgi:uncharacterized DUF497 family protein